MAMEWEGLDGEIARAVLAQNERVLDTYRADPARVGQDANIERSIVEGAYARRQLFELLQNAADACRGTDGRCEVVLTSSTLYVANNGDPVAVHGVRALMATHDSVKRDEQIGRFGLGFKSVLAVSDAPKIVSRSGSFEFSRSLSEEVLRKQVPGLERYPVMRYARPVDPWDVSRGDPVLQALMKWAATVVVVPVLRERATLASSLSTFPAQFVLFSQHVKRLDIEDRDSGRSRSITLRPGDEGGFVLDDAGRKSTWVVRRETHNPSKEALADGGYAAAREAVEVSWAAPLDGAPKGIGAFWSFFPTASPTTLSGIVNAPWKLADDRESLLPGAFNDELLTTVLPRLVVGALPHLHRADRPNSVLDVLPARGKEKRSYADEVINDPVMRAVSQRPCIPTLAGGLRHPTRVNLHPEGLAPTELALWSSACPDPENWVHHGVSSAESRSKVLRLLRYHERAAVSLRKWVEHLVRTPTVEGSAAAVRLVSSLLQRLPDHREELLKARVLLLDDGSVHTCRRGQVFLPGPGTQTGQLIIDPVLAADPAVVRALGHLGIEIFDDAGELRSELCQPTVHWDRVWAASRKNGVDEAERIFRETFEDEVLTRLRVRSAAGSWAEPGSVFLPGPVIPDDGSRDRAFAVDMRFHQQDRELLERLGLVAAPRRIVNPPVEPWRTVARERSREAFRRHISAPRLPDASIDIDEGRVIWPLRVLPELSPAGRVALTLAAIRQLDGNETWRISRKGGGSPTSRLDPVWDHLARYGHLETLAGPQPVRRCLRWNGGAEIDGIEQPLPYVKEPALSDAICRALRLGSSVDDLRQEDWDALCAEAGRWDENRRFLLYAWAAYQGQSAPPRIKVRKGAGTAEVAATEAAVTARKEVFESLVAAGIPCILAASEADCDSLRDGWDMPPGEEMLTETLEFEPAGEPFSAADRYPPLRLDLPHDLLDLTVQPCRRLEILTATPTGQLVRPLQQHREGRIVYTTASTDQGVIGQIARATDINIRPDAVLDRMEEARRNKLRQEIAAAPDVLDKLILAVGVDDLRKHVPSAALASLESGNEVLDPRSLARLALAVDGYEILQTHRAALDRKRLEPPSTWAGSRAAREWVRSLDLPVEFAGFSGEKRAAEVEVEGPPLLGDLHDYQRVIGQRIRDLLHPEAKQTRGLVALPTGAGKTRVAVQALVEHMAEATRALRIVWVAETDELCEQATQTWSQVWRARGGAGTPLTLSRLWGENEANERDGHQVVVASVAKLDAIQRRKNGKWEAEYGWLVSPSMIVVDEAHRSIGKQYTKALSALGGTARVAEMSVPMLGLTATPFRGFNEEETARLASRYNGNALDAGVFPDDDVYAYLQDMSILARVRQRELAGAELKLSPEEAAAARDLRRILPSVEERLGKNADRNRVIVDSVLELDPSQKVLLFATSVENARVLAAMLSFRGVEARAVSGTTSKHARRRYIDDFRAGRVRVLTNYNVFTEGFDVPQVDAVFITRPTFSPNIYQQMIGRGLRGPLNGGKEEVLIVNVADNLTNFGEGFAFRHFAHLWGGRSAR